MNLIDAEILKILREPYHRYSHWFVEAEVTAYGVNSETTLMFKTEGRAKACKVGDQVQI